MVNIKFSFLLVLVFSQFLGSAQFSQAYYSSVPQIIQRKCGICHYKDGYAPFALSTYEEIKRHSKEMGIVIASGSMPPWKANAHFRDFAGNRSLDSLEKQTLLNWLKADMPLGKRSDWVQTMKEVGLPKPDVLLKMPRPYNLTASNKNTYICYKIPFELDNDYPISGLQFFPGLKTLVHHASYQIFEVAESVDLNGGPDYYVYSEDSINRVDDNRDFNYFKMLGKHGEYPREVYHGGWLPGTSLIKFPKGIGFSLPKRGVLLIRNLHYSPSSVDAYDQSAIGFYCSLAPIERQVGFAAFQPKNPSPGYGWTIPADTIYKAHLNVRFNNDVSLLHINPHMHLIGKTFRAYAVSTKGDTINLVDIPDWDFNWQDFYRFKKMLKIPAGSILHATATYDNTMNNPFNPNQPPKAMAFETGMDESNEMMRLVLLYLPYQEGDEEIELE